MALITIEEKDLIKLVEGLKVAEKYIGKVARGRTPRTTKKKHQTDADIRNRVRNL